MKKKPSNGSIPGSFRDPSGFLFSRDGTLFRQVNSIYRENYDNLMQSGLYPSVSQVNLFRIVLNLYFDQDLELLPDEIYAFVDHDHPYKFFNITEVLE